MPSQMTRQEQKVLLLLIVIVTIGLGIHYVSRRPGHQSVWVESGARAPKTSGKASSVAGSATEKGQNQPPPSLSGVSDSNAKGSLDLNQATLQELDRLPGIGPQKAQLIIEYREAHGGFKAVEELLNVSGIGEKTYSALRQYVRIGGPGVSEALPQRPEPPVPSRSAPGQPGAANAGGQVKPEAVLTPASTLKTVNINTASLEELKSLEQIGEVLARRIIEYRQLHGPFRSPEDIMKVDGIGAARYEANKHRIVVE
jgi:comEA protein